MSPSKSTGIWTFKGEKQRVAIARALATNPGFLIADEPTGNLDSDTSQEIITLFKQLNREENLTIILATYDGELGNNTPRRIRLRDGRIDNKPCKALYLLFRSLKPEKQLLNNRRAPPTPYKTGPVYPNVVPPPGQTCQIAQDARGREGGEIMRTSRPIGTNP